MNVWWQPEGPMLMATVEKYIPLINESGFDLARGVCWGGTQQGAPCARCPLGAPEPNQGSHSSEEPV